MKKRITIILGAGAMCEATSVSTSSLTKKIIDKCEDIERIPKSNKTLIDAILENAKQIYSTEMENSNISKGLEYPMNFEEIFHVLELMPNYLSNSRLKNFISPYRILTDIKETFSNLTLNTVFKNERCIIDTINDEIYDYDCLFQKKGKEYSSFFRQLIDSSGCQLDVFNLNYDTWMEQSLKEYNDGFVDIPGYENKMKRFDVREYYKRDERHIVSHIHGQILFEYPEFITNDTNKYTFQDPRNSLYKYCSYEQAKSFRKRSARSDEYTQAGENIFRCNLITGLMKTEKLLWNPMAAYHNRLMNSLIENSRLLLIGYGFGDIYINALLEQYNAMHYNDKQVVMIDYVDYKKETWWDFPPHKSFFTPDAKTVFVKRIFQRDDWCHGRPKKDIYYSDDNSVCICICGFKKTIENHMDEILKVIK